MKILLTGATGYIAKRLLPVLINKGYDIYACVRDAARFDSSVYSYDKLNILEINFLDKESLKKIPEDIDAAYYLIHSMSAKKGDFEDLEETSACNFLGRMKETKVKQVIYLSGIVNDKRLSKHLKSRHHVEEILGAGQFALTTLRAGIIVGAGSASFEIIRDLVEKLPFMVAPKWLKTRSQPIAIHNVIEYLEAVLLREDMFNNNYDIGGPDILNYREMLLTYADVRNLKRRIIVIPFMSPRLSSYWLFFVTSISFKLAVNLVNSMKVEVVCGENCINNKVKIRLIPYREAINRAFDRIAQQEVFSSWRDALSGGALEKGIPTLINVPYYGCFKDKKERLLKESEMVWQKILNIGGDTGWYYANWLWEIRGFLDRIWGGVGLNRGRKNNSVIKPGDSLDFWRVIYINYEQKRLLLYAEMKLPGEAWLEFNIRNNILTQEATFRPKGIFGRFYWYILLPFHFFIFNGMINKIVEVEVDKD